MNDLLARLERHYGKPKRPRITDPLQQILHENCAYLLSDERRDAAFAALKKRVGIKPRDILTAPEDVLLEVASFA